MCTKKMFAGIILMTIHVKHIVTMNYFCHNMKAKANAIIAHVLNLIES